MRRKKNQEADAEKLNEKTESVLIQRLRKCYSTQTVNQSIDDFFLDALSAEYSRAQKEAESNKKKNWSPFRSFITMIGTWIAMPAVSTLLVDTLRHLIAKQDAANADAIEFKCSILADPVYRTVLALIVVLGGIIVFWKYIMERRYYQETWVRHRLNQMRLEIIIHRYISNADYGDDAKKRFREQVFEQLENNLNKFEENMKGKK